MNTTPIPPDHPLSSPQWLIETATGQRFFACNCPSQTATRTLRYVQANRHLFSIPTQPAAPAKEAP